MKNMNHFEWEYDDGGRAAAGRLGVARDCVCRAIAIATERPYADVYRDLAALGCSPRTGIDTRAPAFRGYLSERGWRWYPTMAIGTGCRVHLTPRELPDDERLIVKVSKHYTAIIDGVIRDTVDPRRLTYDTAIDGSITGARPSRCVYGYWRRRTCPACGGVLTRLSGADGYRVVPVGHASGAITERRSLDVVYACSACEHCEGGDHA